MLNQPRYTDDNNSGPNTRINNGCTKRNVHSTGRSNYGGGGRRLGNATAGGRGNSNNYSASGGNPISNWIQNTRQRRRNQQQGRQQHGQSSGVVVGTEANAVKQMTRNAKYFHYPKSGFETPIEHSLLYAMIQYPERYPESVVKGEIYDEDFEQYLYVKDEKMTTTTLGGGGSGTGSGRRGRGGEERKEEEGSDHAVATIDDDIDNNTDDRRVSYAQLSALLALSAEKNPSTATPSVGGTSGKGGNSDGGGGGNHNKKDEELSIGQALCRKLLRTITRYSDAHFLDRSIEVAEFLNPVEIRCRQRNEKAALKTLLPAYAGYTVSLLTGNPLPLLIGVAALTVEDTMVEETANVTGFSAAGGRTSSLETASLLDECDLD